MLITESMTIRVELYGIPRQRAGTELLQVAGQSAGVSLAQILADLEKQSPELAEACFHEGCLRNGYLASIDGKTFVTDPQTVIRPGQSLLLFSADAGG